jgi:DNA-nicking Smr family endonuclease
MSRRTPCPTPLKAKPRLRSLEDLGAVKKALEAQRRAQAERAALERVQRAQQQRESQLFARSVGPIHPLKHTASAPPPRPRPPAIARQRMNDEAAVLRETLSDEFDVESLLETDEGLSFRREGIAPEVVRKLRRGVWALQAHLDLHGLRREDAREQLGAFLREAVQQGWRCVRVVHGKGLGSPGRTPVLKGKVKSWLAQKEEVIAYTTARASDGGHGALIVLLRPQVASDAKAERANHNASPPIRKRGRAPAED